MKKRLLLLCACIILFTGCSPSQPDSSLTNIPNNCITQAYTASFEKSSLRTYISVFGSQLLYMEMQNTIADFYVYNFQTGLKQKVATIEDFALKGRSNIAINDILYFYISTYNGNDMKNVLYMMDFSEIKMEPISDNVYTQKLIPITEIDKQVVALQGDISFDGSLYTFLEVIDEVGDIEKATLRSNEVSSTLSERSEHNIIYIDGDGEYLYALELVVDESDTNYYLVKYTSDFSFVSATNITSIFNDYEITDNIGIFYASDKFFCITDYSGTSIVCKYTMNEIEMLLCESDLEYVFNYGDSTEYEFFYIRNTNRIYRLNTLTGNMEIQNYSLENEQSIIRCILAYGNALMVVKTSLLESNSAETLYLIPYKD